MNAQCVVTMLYDQTGRGNHLECQGSGSSVGGRDTPASATSESLNISGHKVYALYINPGNSYWHDGHMSGIPHAEVRDRDGEERRDLDVRAQGRQRTVRNSHDALGWIASRSYSPMKKQGAIVLGSGGDCCARNTNQSLGTFYEGAVVLGYPTDTTDASIQETIVAAGYGR